MVIKTGRENAFLSGVFLKWSVQDSETVTLSSSPRSRLQSINQPGEVTNTSGTQSDHYISFTSIAFKRVKVILNLAPFNICRQKSGRVWKNRKDCIFYDLPNTMPLTFNTVLFRYTLPSHSKPSWYNLVRPSPRGWEIYTQVPGGHTVQTPDMHILNNLKNQNNDQFTPQGQLRCPDTRWLLLVPRDHQVRDPKTPGSHASSCRAQSPGGRAARGSAILTGAVTRPLPRRHAASKTPLHACASPPFPRRPAGPLPGEGGDRSCEQQEVLKRALRRREHRPSAPQPPPRRASGSGGGAAGPRVPWGGEATPRAGPSARLSWARPRGARDRHAGP